MTYVRHKMLRKRNGEIIWIEQVISDSLGLFGEPKVNISNTPLYEFEKKNYGKPISDRVLDYNPEIDVLGENPNPVPTYGPRLPKPRYNPDPYIIESSFRKDNNRGIILK